MARWRAEAIRRLPELQKTIAAAKRIMALWVDLSQAFEDAYRAEPRNESLIERIYLFADWCVRAPRGPDAGHDPFSAVLVSFYEDIPRFPPAREDMPRWFPYSEVAENRATFAYHLSADEYDALLKHMAANRHRYRPRPSAKP